MYCQLFSEVCFKPPRAHSRLNNLLKKDVFWCWTKAHRRVFKKHKPCLISALQPYQTKCGPHKCRRRMCGRRCYSKKWRPHPIAHTSKSLNGAAKKLRRHHTRKFCRSFCSQRFHYYRQSAAFFEVVIDHAAIGP